MTVLLANTEKDIQTKTDDIRCINRSRQHTKHTQRLVPQRALIVHAPRPPHTHARTHARTHPLSCAPARPHCSRPTSTPIMHHTTQKKIKHTHPASCAPARPHRSRPTSTPLLWWTVLRCACRHTPPRQTARLALAPVVYLGSVRVEVGFERLLCISCVCTCAFKVQ